MDGQGSATHDISVAGLHQERHSRTAYWNYWKDQLQRSRSCSTWGRRAFAVAQAWREETSAWRPVVAVQPVSGLVGHAPGSMQRAELRRCSSCQG